jgi:FkbM family methyltransferase
VTIRILDVLGRSARLARSVGLGSAFSSLRDAADAAFLRVQRPPLAAHINGIAIRGYLRHRSFLDEAEQPGTTYRDLFVGSLASGMTVVDGGAHVGVYTVLAARGVGPGGQVVALEPDPYNFSALQHNAGSFANARLVRKALAARAGEATFHSSRGTIGGSLRKRDDAHGTFRVETTSVDVELRGIDVDTLLIKLNIEGAEPLALAGMSETLARSREATLFVEVAAHVLGRGGAEALVAQIEALGFRVFAIRMADLSLEPLEGRGPPAKGHLYCVRDRLRGQRTR